MIETDFRFELINNGAVTAIIGSRLFLRDPIRPQTSSYAIYYRQVKNRDMVSEKNRFQITAFSKDTLELENLCQAIINALEGKKVLNSNAYYSNSLLGQTDSRIKLDDGFFWSILTFEFKQSI
ncbi:MAG: hypothetical protein V4549_03700 [Bacteroidota bacterium]